MHAVVVRVTIHDQEGGSFVTFMEHLFKDWTCLKKGTPATVRMRIQFGWAKAGCSEPLPAARCREEDEHRSWSCRPPNSLENWRSSFM